MPHADTATAKPPLSWRDCYAVHPCADVFPMMPDAELDALANNIEVHGLRDPITILAPTSPSERPCVLDGRNRLEALVRAGLDILDKNYFSACETKDVAAYVISRNIRRRHLTKEQQAELIVKTIAADAVTNDRATVARSFSPTTGKKGGSTKDPVVAKAVTEAQKHGISKRTLQNARAKLQGNPAANRARSREKTQPPAPGPKAGTWKHGRPLAQLLNDLNQDERKRLAAMVNLTVKERAAQRPLALRVIDAGYKLVARDIHPDKGGSSEAMVRLNAVRARLKHCI